jgi:hypothetical protein
MRCCPVLSKFIAMSVVAVMSLAVAGAAQQKKGASPDYPHVNLATWFEVDANWPKKPSGFQWGDMPGVAVDRKDRVWIFTRSSPPVQVYEAGGKFVKAWGAETVGKAHHIKIDREGHVWLADIGHHVIRKYDEDGKVLLTLGTPDEPGEDSTHLDKPTDMVISPAGDIFVSDGYGNNRVVHFDRDGKFVKAWGKMGTEPGEFSCPHAIAMDSAGRLYVADRNNVRVQVFEQSGKFVTEWRNVITPWGLWITDADEIWVCGSSPMSWDNASMLGCPPKDQVFMKFDPTGRLLQLWTVPKGADNHEKPGECNWVHCIAVDSKGNLYAGDIKGKRAQKFTRQN